MSDPRVLNIRDFPKGLPPDAVRVCRPGPWGNPYYGSIFGREDAIAGFRSYAASRARTEPDWLEPLRGKRLACWCAPLACHAEVLLELLDG